MDFEHPRSIEEMGSDELGRGLTYAGFALLAYELVKKMVEEPIRSFYWNTTFKGGPFRSYKEDVLSRHPHELTASLLYLADFMQSIDQEDIKAIQELRKHRNDLAHELDQHIPNLDIAKFRSLWERVEYAIFKVSRHNTFLNIGADPAGPEIDWNTVQGPEYVLFRNIIEKVKHFYGGNQQD